MKTFIAFLLLAYSTAAIAQPGTWSKKKDFGGSARYGSVAFSIGSKAYFVGGRDAANKADVWEYDASSDQWTQKGAFPGAARYQAVAFTIGTKGYVGTGASGATFPFTPMYNDLWEYNSTNDSWVQKADLPGVARFGASAFVVNGKAYVATGFNENAPFFLQDVWEYNPADLSNGMDANGNPKGKWTQKNNFGGPARMEAVGFAIGSKGYIGTGGDYSTGILLYNDFWEYNPAGDQWTQKQDFGGVGRSLAVGLSINGKGYIGIGGDFNSQSYPDFWEYDPAANKWTQKADFGSTTRWLAAGFTVNGKGYIGTGGNFTPTYKDLWVYTPSSTGINPLSAHDGLTIFPTIGNGSFQIKSTSGSILKIEAFAANGAMVYSKEQSSADANLDLRQNANGIYLIRIVTASGTIQKRVSIQK